VKACHWRGVFECIKEAAARLGASWGQGLQRRVAATRNTTSKRWKVDCTQGGKVPRRPYPVCDSASFPFSQFWQAQQQGGKRWNTLRFIEGAFRILSPGLAAVFRPIPAPPLHTLHCSALIAMSPPALS
jgi:hypothetical protein